MNDDHKIHVRHLRDDLYAVDCPTTEEPWWRRILVRWGWLQPRPTPEEMRRRVMAYMQAHLDLIGGANSVARGKYEFPIVLSTEDGRGPNHPDFQGEAFSLNDPEDES